MLNLKNKFNEITLKFEQCSKFDSLWFLFNTQKNQTFNNLFLKLNGNLISKYTVYIYIYQCTKEAKNIYPENTEKEFVFNTTTLEKQSKPSVENGWWTTTSWSFGKNENRICCYSRIGCLRRFPFVAFYS